jgi:uncharacterized phiE125 gp8 family phage protein
MSYYYGGPDTVNNPYFVVERSTRLPISIDQVKQQCRIDSCDKSDDSLIRSIILSVARYFELYTNRILLNTEFQTFRNYFPGYIELRKSRFSSLVSFEYYVDGVLTEVDEADYQILQSPDYARIIPRVNNPFPTDADCIGQAIVINFVAGYGARSSDIPDDIKTALAQHAAFLWTNRGDCDCSDAGSSVPPIAKSIYNLNRIKNITGLSI